MFLQMTFNHNTLKSCFTTQQVQGIVPYDPIKQTKNKVPMAQSQPSNNARIANILYYAKHALNGGYIVNTPICKSCNCNNGNNQPWKFHKYKN
jgi:hypothetical protein